MIEHMGERTPTLESTDNWLDDSVERDTFDGDLVDGEEEFETGVEMCAEDQEITEHLFWNLLEVIWCISSTDRTCSISLK